MWKAYALAPAPPAMYVFQSGGVKMPTLKVSLEGDDTTKLTVALAGTLEIMSPDAPRNDGRIPDPRT